MHDTSADEQALPKILESGSRPEVRYIQAGNVAAGLTRCHYRIVRCAHYKGFTAAAEGDSDSLALTPVRRTKPPDDILLAFGRFRYAPFYAASVLRQLQGLEHETMAGFQGSIMGFRSDE
jgi:hypothetical protein